MLKAWKISRSLNSEQRSIIEQKQVKLNRPIGELIELLQPIANMDTNMSNAGCSTGCSMFVVVAVAIGGNVAGTAMNLSRSVLSAWFLFCVVLFFAPLVIYLKTRNLNVSDNLRVTGLPLLHLLREDADLTEAMHLELDLREPMAKEKLVRTESPRQRMSEKYYRDPWMRAELVLADGSRLRWSIDDMLRHRTVTKKASSGKWKTKTKDSRKCTVDVELTVRNKFYEVAGASETGEKKSTLTASKTMKIAGSEPANPKLIVEVISDVFQQLRPAK